MSISYLSVFPSETPTHEQFQLFSRLTRAVLCRADLPEHLIDSCAKKSLEAFLRFFLESVASPGATQPLLEQITPRQLLGNASLLQRISNCFAEVVPAFQQKGIDPYQYRKALLQGVISGLHSTDSGVQATSFFDQTQRASTEEEKRLEPWYSDQTLLFQTVESGNLALVEMAWSLQTTSFEEGRAALIRSLEIGYDSITQFLLDKGVQLFSDGKPLFFQAIDSVNLNFGFCRTLDDGKPLGASDRGQVVSLLKYLLRTLPETALQELFTTPIPTLGTPLEYIINNFQRDYLSDQTGQHKEQIELCQLLIDRGLDLNTLNSRGETYLIQAAKIDSEKPHYNPLFLLLLERGADPNQISQDGHSLVDDFIKDPLKLAILLEKGWKVPMFHRDRFLLELLEQQAWYRLDQFQPLFDQIKAQLKQLVNIPNQEGILPLTLALSPSAGPHIVQMLLMLGADRTKWDAEEGSFITKVLKAGDLRALEECLYCYDFPIELAELPENLFLPENVDLRHHLLKHAVRLRQHELLTTLLPHPISAGIFPTVSDFIADCLQVALFEMQEFEIAKLLFQWPVAEESDESGHIWTHIITRFIPFFFDSSMELSQKREIIRLLLQKGAEPKMVARHHRPYLLAVAVELGSKKCQEPFVERRFSRYVMDDRGRTAYAIAIEKGQIALADKLVQAGVDPNLSIQTFLDALPFPATEESKKRFGTFLQHIIPLETQWDGKTFFEHLFAKARQLPESADQWDYVKILLEKCPHRRHSTLIEGEPLLLFALRHDLHTLLNYLLTTDRGLINQKGEGGLTPLLWAVEKKDKSLISKLLALGADPLLHTKEYGSALDLAKNDSELLLLLLGWSYNCPFPEMSGQAYQPLPAIREFNPPDLGGNPLALIGATLPEDLKAGLEHLKARLENPEISNRANLRFYVSCLLQEAEKRPEKKEEILEMLANLQDRCYAIEEELEQNYWLYCFGVKVSSLREWIAFEAWYYRIATLQNYCAKHLSEVHDANQLRQALAQPLGIPVYFKDTSEEGVTDQEIKNCLSLVRTYYPHYLLKLLKGQLTAAIPKQGQQDTRVRIGESQNFLYELLIRELIPSLVTQKRIEAVRELIRRYHNGQTDSLQIFTETLWEDLSLETLLSLDDRALQTILEQTSPDKIDRLLQDRAIASGVPFYDELAPTITDQQLYDYLVHLGWFEGITEESVRVIN